MSLIPAALRDAEQLLSKNGFACSSVWYHGTSSALLDSITTQGLKRSGDKAIKQAAKQTMATIGNNYTESIEPVFLTQSKQLAYYWAEQTVRNRAVRIDGEQSPVVLAVNLPGALLGQVQPDVGAASLLLVEGEAYMVYLAELYQAAGLSGPDIDLKAADRLEYLDKLGMAYFSGDIDAQYLAVVE